MDNYVTNVKPYGKKFSEIKTFVVFGDSLWPQNFIPQNILSNLLTKAVFPYNHEIMNFTY